MRNANRLKLLMTAMGIDKIGINRIKLYKVIKDVKWDYVVHYTGIPKHRLQHLAYNQDPTNSQERKQLAKLFECSPDDFLPESIIVDLRGVIEL